MSSVRTRKMMVFGTLTLAFAGAILLKAAQHQRPFSPQLVACAAPQVAQAVYRVLPDGRLVVRTSVAPSCRPSPGHAPVRVI